MLAPSEIARVLRDEAASARRPMSTPMKDAIDANGA